MFYNTIHQVGPALSRSQAKAKSQQEVILDFFLSHPGNAYTPAEVHAEAIPTALLTSVRRAISDLTKKGHLEKTMAQADGLFGKPNYLWRLKLKRQEQRQLWT